MALYLKKDLRAGNPGAAGIQLFLYLVVTLAPGSPVTHLRGAQSGQCGDRAAQSAAGHRSALLVQYLQWLGRIVRGDLGLSFDSARRPVADLIKERMPATITLSLASIILGWGSVFPWASSRRATSIPSWIT